MNDYFEMSLRSPWGTQIITKLVLLNQNAPGAAYIPR